MRHRRGKMASFILCFVSLLCCVHVSSCQNLTTLSPLEKQAVLVLHGIIQDNPGLSQSFDFLLKASNQSDTVIRQLTQGVTENPTARLVLSALLKGIDQLPTNAANKPPTGNGSIMEPEMITTGGESSSELLQIYMQSLGNLIFSGLTQEIFKEVAQNPNIYKDGKINTTVLLNTMDPLTVLQNAVSQLGSVRTLLPNNESMVSNQCYQDFVDTIDSAVSRNGWAMEMLDAFGKPSAGIFRGSFYFAGSYDECYLVKPKISKGDSMGSRHATKSREFGTRFCRADFNIDSFTKSLNVDTKGYDIKLIWGMCVPESCHSTDMKNVLKLGFLKELAIPVERVYCVDDENLSEDKSAVAAITVLAVFGFLIVVGTLYDIFKPEPKPVTQEKSESSIEEAKPEVELNHPSYTNVGYQSTEVPVGYMHHREDDTHKKKSASNGTARNEEKQTANGKIDREIQRVKQTEKKPQQPLIDRFLLCFSAYSNIPRLLNAKSNDSAVSCIHGIRFFSLTWVVLGHTYNYGIISIQETYTANNLLDFQSVLQRFTYQAVIAGGYAVDTFFVLSAFLMTWLQLKERRKRHGRCSVDDAVMFYFHRFWRLTPIYMIVLMIYACVYPHVISGPYAPSDPSSTQRCRDNWWTNLLYVNNLVHVDGQCMGWSWYLANDMQFYVISPIFLLIMYISTGFGAISTLALMCLGIGIAFWKEHVTDGNFFAMLSDGGEWWRTVYTVPWCRVHCWAVGMLLGLLIYKRDRKPISSKWINALCWLIATGVALFLVYIPYTENKMDGTKWTRTERAFYESFGRTAWGICVAWVIFVCYTGKGGIVNSILSWNGFIPLSRLTYATYLVHPICMMTYSFNRRNALYVNDYGIIYLYFGHLVMSHMVAFVCSVCFEAPFMQLEKVMIGAGQKKQK